MSPTYIIHCLQFFFRWASGNHIKKNTVFQMLAAINKTNGSNASGHALNYLYKDDLDEHIKSSRNCINRNVFETLSLTYKLITAPPCCQTLNCIKDHLGVDVVLVGDIRSPGKFPLCLCQELPHLLATLFSLLNTARKNKISTRFLFKDKLQKRSFISLSLKLFFCFVFLTTKMES